MVYRRCALCGYACPTERTSGVCPTCTQHLLTHPMTFARQLRRDGAPGSQPPMQTITVKVRTKAAPVPPTPKAPRPARRTVERRVWRMAWRGFKRLWR